MQGGEPKQSVYLHASFRINYECHGGFTLVFMINSSCLMSIFCNMYFNSYMYLNSVQVEFNLQLELKF